MENVLSFLATKMQIGKKKIRPKNTIQQNSGKIKKEDKEKGRGGEVGMLIMGILFFFFILNFLKGFLKKS